MALVLVEAEEIVEEADLRTRQDEPQVLKAVVGVREKGEELPSPTGTVEAEVLGLVYPDNRTEVI